MYCLSKKETEECAADLKKRGFTALAYHSGLSRPVREAVQDAFLKNVARIVCATVAFGMGIDKPDVRFVVHYDIPKSVESYYQETGRPAGTGGLQSASSSTAGGMRSGSGSCSTAMAQANRQPGSRSGNSGT